MPGKQPSQNKDTCESVSEANQKGGEKGGVTNSPNGLVNILSGS